jgi:hypothetical protein
MLAMVKYYEFSVKKTLAFCGRLITLELRFDLSASRLMRSGDPKVLEADWATVSGATSLDLLFFLPDGALAGASG